MGWYWRVGLDVGFAVWDFEFLANTQLPRVGDAIGFHELAIGHLKPARDGVEVVAAVEDVFGHGRGGCACLNGWLGRCDRSRRRGYGSG